MLVITYLHGHVRSFSGQATAPLNRPFLNPTAFESDFSNKFLDGLKLCSFDPIFFRLQSFIMRMWN